MKIIKNIENILENNYTYMDIYNGNIRVFKFNTKYFPVVKHYYHGTFSRIHSIIHDICEKDVDEAFTIYLNSWSNSVSNNEIEKVLIFETEKILSIKGTEIDNDFGLKVFPKLIELGVIYEVDVKEVNEKMKNSIEGENSFFIDVETQIYNVNPNYIIDMETIIITQFIKNGDYIIGLYELDYHQNTFLDCIQFDSDEFVEEHNIEVFKIISKVDEFKIENPVYNKNDIEYLLGE